MSVVSETNKRERAEEYTKIFSRTPNELMFMYDKLSVAKPNLAYWFTLQEFTDIMMSKFLNHETIDDKVVLSVMISLYRLYFVEPVTKVDDGSCLSKNRARRIIMKQCKKMDFKPDPILKMELEWK